MIAPEPFLIDRVCSIAFWHNVLIVDVAQDLDVEHTKALWEAHRQLASRHPAGIVALSIVRADVPISSAEARNENVLGLQDLGDRLRHTALVVEARGVVAMMLKSVVRSIGMLRRNNRISYPEDIERAILTLQPHVVPATPSKELASEFARAVAMVRSMSSSPRASLRHMQPK